MHKAGPSSTSPETTQSAAPTSTATDTELARRERRRELETRRSIRANLRRHGLVRRPAAIRGLLRQHDLRFTERNRVEFFENGREGLTAMLEAIESAERRIHLETYILRSDAVGLRFLDALAEKAVAGVEVRVLYDGLGSFGFDRTRLGPLLRAGGVAVPFNPVRFSTRWLPRRRDHRKILTVDGSVGFTGGLNVGDEYWATDPDDRACWRDTHLRIRGPAVRDLDAVFLESWFRADAPDLPWQDVIGRTPGADGEVRCAMLPDGPVYRRRRTRDLVTALLKSATRRVCFTSPYFSPGNVLLAALAHAASRGVQVHLLVAGQPSDHPFVRHAAHSLYPDLLSSGVRVHEYQGAMMHAKVAVFDGRIALVGSSNLDRQSLRHSYELNVVMESEDVARQLEETFDRDVACSRPVDRAALEGRSWLERVFDWIAGRLMRLT